MTATGDNGNEAQHQLNFLQWIFAWIPGVFPNHQGQAEAAAVNGGPKDFIAPDMIYEKYEEDEFSCTSSYGVGSSGHSLNSRNSNCVNSDLSSLYPVTILYGSETGKAKGFARDMAEEAYKYGFRAKVMELDEAVRLGFQTSVSNGMIPSSAGCNRNDQQIRHKDSQYSFPVIIIVSTYIEGQPPENAQKFNDMLYEKSKDVNAYLSGVDYCMYGVGDSMYGETYFNAVAKKFDKILPKLGANRLIELQCGDDDQDLGGHFINWKYSSVWPELKAKYLSTSEFGTGLNSIKSTSDSLVDSCPFTVEILPKADGELSNSIRSDQFPHDTIAANSAHYFTAMDCEVTTKRELRSSEDESGSTLHFELDVSEAFDYETGDLLGVLPANDSCVVEKLARALNFDLDDVFLLLPSNKEFLHLFPTPCTVRECLTRYCDLTSPLSRQCVKNLVTFASSPRDFSKLTYFSSSQEEYQRKIIDCNVGLVDIICDICPSIKLSLKHFIYICRRLQPRFYAISSSSLVYPKSSHFTVSIPKDIGEDGRLFNGVCTSYLQKIERGSMLRVFCRESTKMRPPSNPKDTVIMVGPGTGIGALRAILQERSYQKNELGMEVGKTILYFGCKTHWLDDIYASEVEKFRKDGTLDQLHVAYSREHVEKVYVQYLLAKNAEEIFHLLYKQKAQFLLSGGEKMGKDVFHALVAIFAVYGNLGPQGALKIVESLRKDERLRRQTWT